MHLHVDVRDPLHFEALDLNSRLSEACPSRVARHQISSGKDSKDERATIRVNDVLHINNERIITRNLEINKVLL